MNDGEISPGFDFSGLNVFWKIIEKLEKDEHPPETEWEEMFESPGYRTLLNEGFSTGFFRENFTLAFMPSMAEKLKNILESENDIWYLPHYARVKEMRGEIEKHIDSLDHSGITRSAIAAAKSYLPVHSSSTEMKVPAVSFVVFKYDARGGQDPVVIDALASMDWGDLSLFLGHEFHHYLRNSLPFAVNFLNSDTIETCLVNQLISAESEGIADLINREQECSSEAWKLTQERYEHLLALAPDSIMYLDKWLVENYLYFPKSDGEKCDALSAHITDSGHQMGYYMAKAILRHFPREKLVATVGRPFAFFNLYQKSAEVEGLPAFSSRSLEILHHLEARYAVRVD